jgi:hypothetical protein
MSRSIKLLTVSLAIGLLGAANFASACSTAAWSANAGTVAGQPNDATPVARYSGKCGSKATAAGQFLTDNTPTAEASYNVRFYVYTSPTAATDVFRAEDATGNAVIKVSYDGTNFGFAVKNGASTVTATSPGTASKWYAIEMGWTSAAAGTFSAKIKGANSATVTNVTVGAFNSALDKIETAKLGQITGPGPVTVDEFDSRRTTFPGFLCRGDANADGAYGSADRVLITNEILGTALVSAGSADGNEDGAVGSQDRIIVTNAILGGTLCPN